VEGWEGVEVGGWEGEVHYESERTSGGQEQVRYDS
jgi:hypothetical protein